jgi:hypothetical protein
MVTGLNFTDALHGASALASDTFATFDKKAKRTHEHLARSECADDIQESDHGRLFMRYMICFIFTIFFAPSVGAESLTARQILERTVEAQGGSDWAQVRTLYLRGHGKFFYNGTNDNPTLAERYEMWREMDPDRSAAHGPDGKVKILAVAGNKPFVSIAFDGTNTYTADGLMDPEKAKAYWANNFGFGIIRQALGPGFVLTRLPDDFIDGHPSYLFRITDPEKQETLFGVDAKTFAIRKAGFMTPRGWHERIYDRFFINKKPRWLQAGHIRLFYNGVKANEIYWEEVKINPLLGPETFRLPANNQKPTLQRSSP